jgi:hypothetical protein
MTTASWTHHVWVARPVVWQQVACDMCNTNPMDVTVALQHLLSRKHCQRVADRIKQVPNLCCRV